jgi:predicted murein hydrolase (TIGR00659 family)
VADEMKENLTQIWVYLAGTPLLGLTATLLAYQVAITIYQKAKMSPFANPMVIAVALLVLILTLTKTSYETYFSGAQFVHFLLGPAIVALAVPLYQQVNQLKRHWFAFVMASFLGSGVAAGVAMLTAWLLGASPVTILSLAPKSVTMAIAMGIADKIGGIPSLTAVLVMVTGILGAILARGVLHILKIHDDTISGFALGVSSHGMGIARAFQLSPEMGAFAGLAMGLSGLLTAIFLPISLHLLHII